MKLKPKRSSQDLEGPDIRASWKDEQSLFVEWHLSEDAKQSIQDHFAIPLTELPFVLRLHDVTEREILNDGQDQYVDFTFNHQAGNWILYGVKTDRKYCVDFGVRMVDGRFYSLSKSNKV